MITIYSKVRDALWNRKTARLLRGQAKEATDSRHWQSHGSHKGARYDQKRMTEQADALEKEANALEAKTENK